MPRFDCTDDTPTTELAALVVDARKGLSTRCGWENAWLRLLSWRQAWWLTMERDGQTFALHQGAQRFVVSWWVAHVFDSAEAAGVDSRWMIRIDKHCEGMTMRRRFADVKRNPLNPQSY